MFQLDEKKQDIPEMFWVGIDLLCWPRNRTPWNSFPQIKITLAGSANTTFDLIISPKQYLRPVHDQYNPRSTEDCYKFAIAPSTTGGLKVTCLILAKFICIGFQISKFFFKGYFAGNL